MSFYILYWSLEFFVQRVSIQFSEDYYQANKIITGNNIFLFCFSRIANEQICEINKTHIFFFLKFIDQFLSEHLMYLFASEYIYAFLSWFI